METVRRNLHNSWMDKSFVALGAFLGALGVALGAFGAHGLKTVLSPDMLATFETGVRYHLIHALAILAVGVLIRIWPEARLLPAAGWLLAAGVLLFSGSLYLLAVSGVRWLGAVTPIGGVALIVGWVLIMLAALRS